MNAAETHTIGKPTTLRQASKSRSVPMIAIAMSSSLILEALSTIAWQFIA